MKLLRTTPHNPKPISKRTINTTILIEVAKISIILADAICPLPKALEYRTYNKNLKLQI